MDRRAFLSILASSPLVFGLRELLAQEAGPDYVAAALKRMKETRRPGVLMVIPPDKEGRKRLGEGLLARMPIGSKGGNAQFELFCATVFVFIDESRARDFGALKPEGEGILRILLDPDGRRLDADRFKLDVFEDSVKFGGSFGLFIQGSGGARLRDLAKAIEKDMPEALKKAADKINGTPDEVQAATIALTEAADSIAPWLLQKGLESSGSKCREILLTYYLRQSAQDPEPALPFGVRVERTQVEDPCPPCGMAAYRPTAYRFLSFHAK